jgi:hypothetical protein
MQRNLVSKQWTSGSMNFWKTSGLKLEWILRSCVKRWYKWMYYYFYQIVISYFYELNGIESNFRILELFWPKLLFAHHESVTFSNIKFSIHTSEAAISLQTLQLFAFEIILTIFVLVDLHVFRLHAIVFRYQESALFHSTLMCCSVLLSQHIVVVCFGTRHEVIYSRYYGSSPVSDVLLDNTMRGVEKKIVTWRAGK